MLRVAMACVLLWCGCAPLAMSRKTELREKTTHLRTGMTGDEVTTVLGQPSSRDGVQCPPALELKTCEMWVYDPTAGLPAYYRGALIVLMIPWKDGLRLAAWEWR